LDFKLLHQFGEIWLTVNLPPLTPATPCSARAST
jgi:hypothetical protein